MGDRWVTMNYAQLIKIRVLKHIIYITCVYVAGPSWMVRLGLAWGHSLCLWRRYQGRHLQKLKGTTRLQGKCCKIPTHCNSSSNIQAYHYIKPIDAIRQLNSRFGVDMRMNVNTEHKQEWLLFFVTNCVPYPAILLSNQAIHRLNKTHNPLNLELTVIALSKT